MLTTNGQATAALVIAIASAITADGAEKDGLSVSVKPTKETFEEKELLTFEVTFKNVSATPFRLMDPTRYYLYSDPTHFANWKHSILPGPWQSVTNVKDRREAAVVRSLKPGEVLTVRAEVHPPFAMVKTDTEQAGQKEKAWMPPGKYEYQPSIRFAGLGAGLGDNNPVPFWVGEITAAPVAFTIGGR